MVSPFVWNVSKRLLRTPLDEYILELAGSQRSFPETVEVTVCVDSDEEETKEVGGSSSAEYHKAVVPEGKDPEAKQFVRRFCDMTEGQQKKLKERMNEFLERWTEEGHVLGQLEHMRYEIVLPYTGEVLVELGKLCDAAWIYVKEFHDQPHQVLAQTDMCGMLLCYVVEFNWTLQFLKEMKALPQQLMRPHDRYIRELSHANKHFQDPGNLNLDVFVHLVKLWRWMNCDDEYVKAIHRQAYGTSPGNCSSKGIVNLRGNMAEMLVGQLQLMGDEKWWEQRKAKGGGRIKTSGPRVGPAIG